MDDESRPEERAAGEPRRDSVLRHARRTWLYTWAGALVALLVILIALVVANTRNVKVSWVLGSTRQSLVWVILVTATLGWLLGIVTSVIFRFRTRQRNFAPCCGDRGRPVRAVQDRRPRVLRPRALAHDRPSLVHPAHGEVGRTGRSRSLTKLCTSSSA